MRGRNTPRPQPPAAWAPVHKPRRLGVEGKCPAFSTRFRPQLSRSYGVLPTAPLQGHLLHLTLSPSTVTTPASQTLPSFRKDVDTWLTVLAIKSHLSENQLRHPRTATLHASPGVSSTSQLTSPANCFQNTLSHLHKLCHSPATPAP